MTHWFDFDSYFVDKAKKLLGLIEKAMGKERDYDLLIQEIDDAIGKLLELKEKLLKEKNEKRNNFEYRCDAMSFT